MKKDKISMRVDIETALEDRPMSEVNFCIRMQKFTLFLYKEGTVFWTFFPVFMGSFLYFLWAEGLTQRTMLLGIIESILYLAFYHGIIKKIHPFNKRASEYEQIKDKLDVLLDYREQRIALSQ